LLRLRANLGFRIHVLVRPGAHGDVVVLFLISIMSAGTEFRESKKTTQFRALMEQMKAQWQDLPAGSFSSAGTNINTLILRVWADGRARSY
jgi:hypothetical protein